MIPLIGRRGVDQQSICAILVCAVAACKKVPVHGALDGLRALLYAQEGLLRAPTAGLLLQRPTPTYLRPAASTSAGG
jgi:hypothetical protein